MGRKTFSGVCFVPKWEKNNNISSHLTPTVYPSHNPKNSSPPSATTIARPNPSPSLDQFHHQALTNSITTLNYCKNRSTKLSKDHNSQIDKDTNLWFGNPGSNTLITDIHRAWNERKNLNPSSQWGFVASDGGCKGSWGCFCCLIQW